MAQGITPTGVKTTRPGQSMATVRGGVQPGGGSTTFGFGTPQAKAFMQAMGHGANIPEGNLPADIEKREMKKAIEFHKKNQQAIEAVQQREQTTRNKQFEGRVKAYADLLKNAPKDDLGNPIKTDFMNAFEQRILLDLAGNRGGLPNTVPGMVGQVDPKTGKVVQVPGMVPEQFRGQAAGVTGEQAAQFNLPGAPQPGAQPTGPAQPDLGTQPGKVVKGTVGNQDVEAIGEPFTDEDGVEKYNVLVFLPGGGTRKGKVPVAEFKAKPGLFSRISAAGQQDLPVGP